MPWVPWHDENCFHPLFVVQVPGHAFKTSDRRNWNAETPPKRTIFWIKGVLYIRSHDFCHTQSQGAIFWMHDDAQWCTCHMQFWCPCLRRTTVSLPSEPSWHVPYLPSAWLHFWCCFGTLPYHISGGYQVQNCNWNWILDDFVWSLRILDVLSQLSQSSRTIFSGSMKESIFGQALW